MNDLEYTERYSSSLATPEACYFNNTSSYRTLLAEVSGSKNIHPLLRSWKLLQTFWKTVCQCLVKLGKSCTSTEEGNLQGSNVCNRK